MKNLLLLLTVFIGVNCWGQGGSFGLRKDTSSAKYSGVQFYTLDTLPTTIYASSSSGWRLISFPDTIKVIMLCCDTSSQIMEVGVWDSVANKVKSEYHKWYDEIGVYWQFGYMVLNNPTPLDKNKKPLPKNIIVWQYREVK